MSTNYYQEPQDEDVLIEGLTRELYHDGQLMILNFKHSMSRAVVDKFYDTYVAYGESMEPSKDRFVVYQFHKSHIAVTPYLGAKVGELNDNYPGETGGIAMAIPMGAIRNILRFFVKRRQHTQPDLKFEFYGDRESAIRWVESVMKKKNVIA